MQPCYCIHCGIGFDLDRVPLNPFRRCPNPTCKVPLDEGAIAHSYAEASNPTDRNDPARKAAREQHLSDIAAHPINSAAARKPSGGF